jgi:hypothetical protein
MKTRLIILLVLPLLFLGCEDDTTTPPPPPTALSAEDQQVIANCRALQASIEAYAAAHGGSYGEYWLRGGISLTNPYSGEYEPSFGIPCPGQVVVNTYTDCNNGDVLGYRIIGYGMVGAVITLENMSNVPSEARTWYDATMANIFLVYDAAKSYATANDGEYPGDVSGSQNLDGKTLIDYLPGGSYILNALTSVSDNPVDGAAGSEGAIGYIPTDMDGDGIYDAFVIDAVGCHYNIIATVVPYSEKEEHIWHDAFSLRSAVYQFHQASGHYPHNLDTETTPGGKTVLDLCADKGKEFENPYTDQIYVPALGIAANKGEVAYQPIEDAGLVTGYTITGRGVFEEIIRLGPLEY